MSKFEMYPAYSPQEVVRKIAKNIEVSSNITIFLNSGISFDGSIVSIEKNGHDDVVLMQTSEAALSYFLLADIKAVKIQSPEVFSGILSSGVKFRPDHLPAPTKLGLKRRVEGLSTTIKVDWPGFNLNSRDELFNFDDLITALNDTLEKIKSDEMGRASLASIKSIELVSYSGSNALNFRKADDKIVIEFNSLNGLTDQITNSIKDSLECLL